jgi:hypothetical protein
MNKDLVLLDDGEFYIELNCNHDAVIAPGFLERRCERGLTTPEGFECVGGFSKRPDGSWRADINAPWDEESDSDCRVVADGVERMNAIAALWQRRHEALCSHRRN